MVYLLCACVSFSSCFRAGSCIFVCLVVGRCFSLNVLYCRVGFVVAVALLFCCVVAVFLFCCCVVLV